MDVCVIYINDARSSKYQNHSVGTEEIGPPETIVHDLDQIT